LVYSKCLTSSSGALNPQLFSLPRWVSCSTTVCLSATANMPVPSLLSVAAAIPDLLLVNRSCMPEASQDTMREGVVMSRCLLAGNAKSGCGTGKGCIVDGRVLLNTGGIAVIFHDACSRIRVPCGGAEETCEMIAWWTSTLLLFLLLG
jgi:hypothetical protein